MSNVMSEDVLARVKTRLTPVAEGICGEKGTAWIADLESLIAGAAKAWGLSDIEPVPNITYNFVAFATVANGTKAVLKIGIPDKESPFEPLALQAFHGRGMAKPIALDPATNTMLLERADPGWSMEDIWSSENDEELTYDATNLIKRLHEETPALDRRFPTLGDWFKSVGRMHSRNPNHSYPLPQELITQAEATFGNLFESAKDQLMVHGDLHHGNILHHHNGWIAIDPKGLVAELAYEPANLICNPMTLVEADNLHDLLAKRIDIFSQELGVERDRIQGYAFAHSVMSVVWTLEDIGSVPEEELIIPRALADLAFKS